MKLIVFMVGMIATGLGLLFLISAIGAPLVIKDAFGPNYALANWAALCSIASFAFASICLIMERNER